MLKATVAKRGGVHFSRLKTDLAVGDTFNAQVIADNGWSWTRRVRITEVEREPGKTPKAWAEYAGPGPSKIDLANAQSRKKFKEGNCWECKQPALITTSSMLCQGCRKRPL